jgi:hypothetical protein
VAHFPSDATELRAIKICPAEGYIQLISFALILLVLRCSPFPFLILAMFIGTDPHRVRLRPHAPRDPGRKPPARARGEEEEGRGEGNLREEEVEERGT